MKTNKYKVGEKDAKLLSCFSSDTASDLVFGVSDTLLVV